MRMAVTDQENSEMFKQLLKDTMKNQNHPTQPSIIAKHAEKIEYEAKANLDTNGKIEQLGIVVTITENEEKLKESRKICPRPKKLLQTPQRIT